MAVTQDECEFATCYNYIPAKCTDPDGTWQQVSDGSFDLDEAWCRDQTKCGRFVDSMCTNGDVGGVLDDCPRCYSFAPSRCENYNPNAEAAGDLEIPFTIHFSGSEAVTEEKCDKEADACVFSQAQCVAASPDHAKQFVTAISADNCASFKGGCTWNKAYTYKKQCEYTAPVPAQPSVCSDKAIFAARAAAAALAEAGMAPVGGAVSGSFYGFTSADFVAVPSMAAPEAYTGSCFDGVQNGDEKGVDCDGTQYGAACPACPTTTTTTTTTAAPTAAPVATTTTAAPTEGPVEVSPAGAITTSLISLVLLAVSALFLF